MPSRGGPSVRSRAVCWAPGGAWRVRRERAINAPLTRYCKAVMGPGLVAVSVKASYSAAGRALVLLVNYPEMSEGFGREFLVARVIHRGAQRAVACGKRISPSVIRLREPCYPLSFIHIDK